MNPYQASNTGELDSNVSNAISPFAVLGLTVLWPMLVAIGWIAGDWNQTFRHSSIWSGTGVTGSSVSYDAIVKNASL